MYPDPNLGATEASGGALDGTTGTLTAAGLAAFPALAGPIPFATGTYGYGATVDAGAPYTSLLANSAGQALAGVYQHPSTDPQAGVAELSLYFDYNAAQLQWLLLAPGLINWVTQGTHLGLDRNYVEMDIDDTFTPDNAWSTTVHDNDYSDADSQRMDPQDVITAADWSNPTRRAPRPPGRQASRLRPSAWTSCSTTAARWSTRTASWTCPASRPPAPRHRAGGTCGPDPLLAQFQAKDPATGKPYANDFGWLSHTYDTPYLDVGCATQDYIEAELNENTSRLDGQRRGHARHRRPGLGRPDHPGRFHRRRQPLRDLQPAGLRARQPLRVRRPGPGHPGHRRPARPGRGHRQYHRGHAGCGYLRVRGDRPVQRGRLDQHRPVPGLCDRRPQGDVAPSW